MHGAPVEWIPLFGDARRGDLPIFAFPRERYEYLLTGHLSLTVKP